MAAIGRAGMDQRLARQPLAGAGNGWQGLAGLRSERPGAPPPPSTPPPPHPHPGFSAVRLT